MTPTHAFEILGALTVIVVMYFVLTIDKDERRLYREKKAFYKQQEMDRPKAIR